MKRNVVNTKELEILQLITEGRTNVEIAKRVKICGHSIETILSRLYDKIGAKNKHHAAAIAVRHDLLFDYRECFKGVPMRINEPVVRRKRLIRNCPELW